MIRRLLILLVLLVPSVAQAQISYYTDKTLVPTTLSGLPQPVAAPIPYAPIRVCNLPLTQVQPCLPLSTITDVNGVTISNSIGSNFGQFNADVTGRFTFGCSPGQNMQIQYAGASNVPAASYPVTCPNASGSNLLLTNNTFSGTNTFNGTTTFGNTVTVNNPLTVNAASTITGATIILCKQLNPSYLCADQFSGTDASAKIQAAIAALPTAGGVVDARNLSDVGGTGSTIIDPGAKAVTLYLGPYSYQIQQIVLETNFHIIGSGMGANSTLSTAPLTVLQSCSSCATTNAIVLGTNGGNGGATQHVLMDGLRIYGTTSDTAIGMNLKTVNGSGTGLWYSTFRNICVGVCGPSGASANGFSGGALILDGTITGSVNQFDDFYNVQAFKTNGGSYALGLLGANGQINFNQCEFDGPTRNDGTTVVQISNNNNTNTGPYSITFLGVTVQHGTTGVNIAGAQNITFVGTHFETVGGAIQINIGTNSVSSTDITFIASTCQNFCGNNGGTGFFAKNLSPSIGTDVAFFKNQFAPGVDAIYVGFSNFQGFTSIGDESSTTGTINPQPSIGLNIPIQVAFTTTAVTSETVTVTGANASSHCWAEATNATAAALTGVFLSGQTTNAVTINHSATSGGTFNVFCTPN